MVSSVKKEVIYMQVIHKNHMEILWHDYAEAIDDIPITNAGIIEKSSVIGRTGLMLLSCGTGAWRVRQSMNTLAEQLGLTCTADIGLMSIEYTCFDGEECYSQSLCLTNTGVNTSKLNRLEQFINKFSSEGVYMTGEELHSHLDQIEKIHGLYSPTALGFAAALACGAFTFLLGGGPVEMFCAFAGAGIGNFVRCKLGKHHFTLFLCIFASVTSACLVYAGLFEVMKLILGVSEQHEAGYICSMLFIIPGFPFITSGIDIAKKHGIRLEHLDYVQIHPTTLYSKKPGRRFLISESVRGEGALLYDKNGNRFIDELLPRDVVTKAIQEQMKKDGTDHVWLSLEKIPKEIILSHFPNIYQHCLEEGYDATKEWIPVVPAQHYFMGGIWVDSDSHTSMPNLYAVGETSCNGVHGKNRLASNSLLESLVFAKRAARKIMSEKQMNKATA